MSGAPVSGGPVSGVLCPVSGGPVSGVRCPVVRWSGVRCPVSGVQCPVVRRENSRIVYFLSMLKNKRFEGFSSDICSLRTFASWCALSRNMFLFGFVSLDFAVARFSTLFDLEIGFLDLQTTFRLGRPQNRLRTSKSQISTSKASFDDL